MGRPEDPRAKWNATFADNVNLSDLRAAVRRAPHSNPCIQGYRSVCWKAFLLYQSLDRSTWSKVTRNSRSAYESLKEHLLRDIEATEGPSTVDPLAEDNRSSYHTLKQDEALRAEILQDVERCMQEIPFFRDAAVQTMLLNVLFVYCKLNADLGYRQGMHELLAPLLWVVYHDAASVGGFEADTKDKLMAELLDPNHVEHDAFSLFCIIMQTAKSFYETTSTSQQPPGSAGQSSIVERSRRIHEEYLRQTDPELASHLTAIDILPQIFVIRWIRLLFGREFPFDDALSLWDMIFAEDPALTLVDHVCLAMLLRVRWQLMEADYSSALTLLLRYPAPKTPQDAPTLVNDAVYLSKNMNLQGGSAVIRKYTGKTPLAALAEAGGEPVKRKGTQTPQSGSVDLTKRLSPLRSTSEYLQNQGGLEAMLQGAAKGVYSKGEQWGLNKAIRGAVQNFQTNALSPTRVQSGTRWSLDEGAIVNSTAADLSNKVRALENRHKALADMLAGSIEELTEQLEALETSKAESAATALTLTIAKLQYLQVYLQNPEAPLDSEGLSKRPSGDQPVSSGDPLSSRNEPPLSPTPRGHSRAYPSSMRPSSVHNFKSAAPPMIAAVSAAPAVPEFPIMPGAKSTAKDPVHPIDIHSTPVNRSPESGTAAASANPQPGNFAQPRPSLAESSYSWMLGGDQTAKSNFVSARTPSPRADRVAAERKRNAARGKAGFLFGDKADDDDGEANGTDKSKRKEEEEKRDGFTLGTLKGGPPGDREVKAEKSEAGGL